MAPYIKLYFLHYIFTKLNNSTVNANSYKSLLKLILFFILVYGNQRKNSVTCFYGIA
jgi:hypothetical protein